MKERHSKIVTGIVFSGFSLFFFVFGIGQAHSMPTQPSCNGHAMSIHGTCHRPINCSNAGQYGGTCIDPHTNTYTQELNEEIQEKQYSVSELLLAGGFFAVLSLLFFIIATSAIRSFPGNISRKLKQLL